MLDPSLRFDASKAHEVVVGGPATVREDRLELRSGSTTFILTRFDHVLIRIRVLQSRYKLNEYDFVLLGRWEGTAGTPEVHGPGKHEMGSTTGAKMAVQAQILQSLDATRDMAAAYGQTRPRNSMYDMFHRFSELSLLVDDGLG
jgi:hypothetical protein